MKTKLLKAGRGVFAAVAIAVAGFTAPVSATPIIQGGSTSYDFFVNGGGYTLEAAGSILLTSLSSTSATLFVTLKNLSTFLNGSAITNTGDARLGSFGFGISPDVTGVSSFSSGSDGGLVGAVFSTTAGNTQIPGLNGIEVCAYAGSNCAGAGNNGLVAGTTDTFTLVLSGAFNTNTGLDFSPFGAKFQTNITSYDAFCATATCSPVRTSQGDTSVPEPTTLALLGLGLMGFAVARRRKN